MGKLNGGAEGTCVRAANIPVGSQTDTLIVTIRSPDLRRRGICDVTQHRRYFRQAKATDR